MASPNLLILCAFQFGPWLVMMHWGYFLICSSALITSTFAFNLSIGLSTLLFRPSTWSGDFFVNQGRNHPRFWPFLSMFWLFSFATMFEFFVWFNWFSGRVFLGQTESILFLPLPMVWCCSFLDLETTWLFFWLLLLVFYPFLFFCRSLAQLLSSIVFRCFPVFFRLAYCAAIVSGLLLMNMMVSRQV